MDYFPKRDLWIKITRLKWTESKIENYAEQLISVYEYMHSEEIAHLNIRPQHILLSEYEKTVFVTNFGNSQPFAMKSDNNFFDSISYLSPEMKDLYLARRYDHKNSVKY
jgi:serine/threonine protein kinase